MWPATIRTLDTLVWKYGEKKRGYRVFSVGCSTLFWIFLGVSRVFLGFS